MKFKVEFNTDNAAFDEPYLADEIASALRKIADDIYSTDYGHIFDSNGNRVGEWRHE